MRHILRHKLALVIGFASLMAAPVMAEPFTLLVFESPEAISTRDDTGAKGQAYWAGYNRFAKNLIEAGALRGGTALAVSKEALPQRRDGRELGGYFIIDAPSLAAAKALAATVPSELGAVIEVRRAVVNPTMKP